jgi:hypothetical protein
MSVLNHLPRLNVDKSQTHNLHAHPLTHFDSTGRAHIDKGAVPSSKQGYIGVRGWLAV